LFTGMYQARFVLKELSQLVYKKVGFLKRMRQIQGRGKEGGVHTLQRTKEKSRPEFRPTKPEKKQNH
jgi:hypothetical protein